MGTYTYILGYVEKGYWEQKGEYAEIQKRFSMYTFIS